jgi:hypothetical protein
MGRGYRLQSIEKVFRGAKLKKENFKGIFSNKKLK